MPKYLPPDFQLCKKGVASEVFGFGQRCAQPDGAVAAFAHAFAGCGFRLHVS